MKRKREVTCVYFSPGPVLVFLSIFISTINGGEIKVNSGVKYDSGDKGVTVSAGGSLSVNLNSKDVNMDMSSVLQICDFKDRIRIDIVQNRKVKVILEPSLQNECIEAQLYTYGCHGDGTCPTVSHTQRSGAEETYLLFNVGPDEEASGVKVNFTCVLLVLLTTLVAVLVYYRCLTRRKSKDGDKTQRSRNTTEDPRTKVYERLYDETRATSALLEETDYLSDNNNTTDRHHVKMSKAGATENSSVAAVPLLLKGLLCVLIVSSLVWLGMSGYREKSEVDVSVLKISVPSKTHVRHIRSYSESPDITDVDLGQDRSISLLTKLQLLDLSSECRHNLSLCRTHALCDSTNPDAGLQCRCNQGYYLRDLTCVPCQTSCEEGFYMTQQCGATNDVICKPCSVCVGTTYAAAQCTSTQDTICIDVTFPIRHFIENLQKTDDQLVLNYTLSENVFLEQLYKIRQLQQPLYTQTNNARMDLLFERPSGLEVKITVEGVYLIPEYVDFDYEDDIKYVMNHAGFPQDYKDQVEEVVAKYCSHPLPSEYDLHLHIIRNISTAAAEITCDSKNDKLPPCPSGYKDGDRYVYQALTRPCRKLNMENFTEYFNEVQETKNAFRELRNNILCSDNPDLLSKIFHVAVQDSVPLTFPSDVCESHAAECQRCLAGSSCRGRECCDNLDCYASTSCRNLYSACPVAPVQCTRGDVSKLSIVPRYSDISKEFSCHLQHHAPEYLYVITYTPRIPSMNLSLPARSKRFPYYNITHQEVGSDSVEYLLVSHHTNIPLHEEVMFLGTFGNDDEGKKNVDFSLHSLKESREFNRAKSFNIRRKSSTSLRTKIQFERPFLYSTRSWKLDGCEKNVSQIITPQPLYHTQGQPLKQMIRKKRNNKFVYELLVVGKTPHVKFTIPENTSVLSYYKEDFSGSVLNKGSLRGDLIWDKHSLYWNITVTGSISSCPGYFSIEVYKGAPLTRLALYDMIVNCPHDFTLKFFVTHQSVEIPDIFTIIFNDSVTSYQLVLSSVRTPQLFHSEGSDMVPSKKPHGSPWLPIILILIVCICACTFLLVLYIYCDSKQSKGIPLDITMPKPDLGAHVTLLQNMDVIKPTKRLSLQSKVVMVTLVVLYVVYALAFTFLILFGMLHLVEGPRIGELAVGSNTSAKIHNKVRSHLSHMVAYEKRETTRLVQSTQHRLEACSSHLSTSVNEIMPEATSVMRNKLLQVFKRNGTVHATLKKYFVSRIKEYQPQIHKFIDEFNQTLDRNLHEFHITYKSYLRSISENHWLEFPKQVFLQQEREEGRKFSVVDDENRARFMTWLEIDKVQEMINVKDILMKRMLSMMPGVNFSKLLEDTGPELETSIKNHTYHENWIKFNTSSRSSQGMFKKTRLQADKKGNRTQGQKNSTKQEISNFKGLLYGLFLGVFFVLDVLLLIYRFSWLVKCVKMFKKGIDQRVPFDSITRKIHFILTGKEVPKVGENLEYPYDCALDALNKKENIWGDNTELYFMYCQASAKSREDILKEIFHDRQQDKPKIEKSVERQRCCCIHYFIKCIKLLYRMFISPIFWRFVSICGFVLLLCLVTKVTHDLVTVESAMFLLDTDAVWPVLARQEAITNEIIAQQGLPLNNFIENYKNILDAEIQMLNSIMIEATKNQSQVLNSLISDLCNISNDGLCTPDVGVDLVIPTLISCNFLPLKPQLYTGSHRTDMLEYIRAELFPLINNLRSILFSAFYLLLTFVSVMLVCQICARVLFVYLLKSRHLRTNKIYQLSSSIDQDPQDFPEKDIYERQSLIAESCESGVYDMTS